MDPKLAWGPEVFSGAGEGRGLASPLRQKQAMDEDEGAKGPRYDPSLHMGLCCTQPRRFALFLMPFVL